MKQKQSAYLNSIILTSEKYIAFIFSRTDKVLFCLESIEIES